MKYAFYNDYSEGCSPRILEILTETNSRQETGYGDDNITNQAKIAIRQHLDNNDVDIHFVSGGTQANLIALNAILLPHQSVIAASSGHINVHEAGAIEATGHKINTIPSKDGKITVEGIKNVLATHTDEHMVQPKVVFISYATELGTIYTKKELECISKFCKNNGLYLYLDGARIGTGLCSNQSDLTLKEITQLIDIFYIGGTKNGALLGEAIVIINDSLKKDFRYYLKQRGGLLAKGRILGAQFLALFENNLYFELAKHANDTAKMLADGIEHMGYKFLVDSPTNQIFPVLPNKVIEKIEKLYGFYRWQNIDKNNSAIRLVTSWATDTHYVESFLADLEKISKNI